MKRRIASLAAVFCLATASVALAQAPAAAPPQGGPGGQGGPNRRMAMMMQGITLTPAQQARIDSINTRYQAQMPAFTPGQPMDSTARANRRDMTMRRDAEIRAALTADQQTMWDHNAEQMRANMPQRP